LSKSLRKKAVSGVRWTVAASLFSSIGGLILLSVFARVLTKSEFGLMAIVNILTIFSVELVDMGIGQAIIQKQKANATQLSSLFWVNFLLGLLVFGLLYFLALPISLFFESPSLIPLIKITSFIFIANGISSQYQALLQRDLRFKEIAFIDVFSFTVYLLLTLFLIFKGFRVFALVWGSLGRSIVRTIFLIILGFKINIPKLVFKIEEIKPFLNFGAFRFGAFILSYSNKKFDSILLGKLLGMEALGVYDIYQRILGQPIKLFSPIINKVSFPLFAKINKDNKKSKIAFLTIFNLLNSLRFPIFVFLIVAAEPIITFFLGAQWLENILVFQLLAGFFLLKTISAFTGTVMVAKGKANWSFYINLIMLCITPLGIFLGSKYLMVGVAIALLLISILTQIPKYYFIVKRILPIKAKEYVIPILKPLLISGVSGLLVYSLSYFEIQSFWLSSIMGIGFTITYGVSTYFLNREIFSEIEKIIPFRIRKKVYQVK